MEFKAKAQFQRVSPQKARLVLDLIKGKRVEDALTTLQFTKKRIAPVIFQLVRSAVENANYLSGEKASTWMLTGCSSSRPSPMTVPA